MDSFFHEVTGQKLKLDENGSSANLTPDLLFLMAQIKIFVIFDGWSLAENPYNIKMYGYESGDTLG